MPVKDTLSYKDAGVDIDAGNSLVDAIKPIIKSRASRPEVLGGLGGFGGLFALGGKYRDPVLVSGTDGVGTKLLLAQEWGMHATIGIDLVAMCVNDIVVTGAEPLFFLDYFATGKLRVETATEVVAGIAEGCHQAGCALIGGETAEMPGMYGDGHYDLAGFAVGAVERDAIIDGSKVAEGDVLLALPSSGLHSNGYSLVRKVLAKSGRAPDSAFAGATLAEALLAPTAIYVKPLLQLIAQVKVKSLAHITGGGLVENLPRVLPEGLCAHIDANTWPRPEVFAWLYQEGVAEAEMWRTFNCGVGMIAVVAEPSQEQALTVLQEHGIAAWPVGRIVKQESGPVIHIDGLFAP